LSNRGFYSLLRQRRKHLRAQPLNPELNQLDPGAILAPVVPEPVYLEDVLLHLAGSYPRKIHDHVFDVIDQIFGTRRALLTAVVMLSTIRSLSNCSAARSRTDKKQ